MDKIKREPALVSGFIAAVIALVTAFGMDLTNDQVGAIMAVTAALLAVLTRQQVTPAVEVLAQCVDGKAVAGEASALSNGTPVTVTGLDTTITPGGLYS